MLLYIDEIPKEKKQKNKKLYAFSPLFWQRLIYKDFFSAPVVEQFAVRLLSVRLEPPVAYLSKLCQKCDQNPFLWYPQIFGS